MSKIIVLMSTYNGEKYLKEQIDSIFKQRCSHDINLLIRDDGSTDNTKSVINSMIKEYGDRISLISGTNIGCNASYFELIKCCPDADFYALSDQDDVWLEDKVDTGVSFIMGSSKPALYASRSYVVDDDLKIIGKTRKRKRKLSFYNTIIQNICPGHSMIMNRELIELLRIELDYSKIYVYDSWITNVANIKGEIFFDNSCHTYYRQHREQVLGYGKGPFGRLLVSLKHSNKGDGKKYREQISYFYAVYKKNIESLGYLKEIEKFLDRNSFFGRFLHLFNLKLYRQSLFETIAFRTAYLFGQF